MATLNKYDLTGKKMGEEAIEDQLLDVKANPQMLKDYLVAIRANQRQWSASTQTRAEVSHSKKKPFNQKGSGNARQGFLGAPQFRGGGRVHAPRPKFDQHVRINRKERRLAVRALLADRVRSAQVHILGEEPEAPKAKTLSSFLKALELSGKRVLFLVGQEEDQNHNLALSLRNLPKVEFAHFSHVSGYDLALNQQLIVTHAALGELKETLGEKK